MAGQNTITLENEFAIVEIKKLGAELASFYLKNSQQEIIWNGNPEFWKRHAPVLFPTVGKLKNNQYEYEGKQYSLPQHGFARDVKFELVQQTAHTCQLQLIASDETKTNYPFEFKFITQFSLINTSLITEYRVENTSASPLFFSLGAHPAFNCPFKKEENFSDYFLSFEKNEMADVLLLSANGLISGNRLPFLNNENQIPLREDLFKNDALVFDDLQSQFLTIQSNKNKQYLKISWNNFPHLGIWKPLNAPFLCIEPWQGMADFENANGKLEDKYGIIQLKEKEVFTASYTVEANF